VSTYFYVDTYFPHFYKLTDVNTATTGRLLICRSARYTFIAIVADHYGRPFVRVLRHPSQYWGWLLLFAAVIFSLIMAGILLNRRLTAATTA